MKFSSSISVLILQATSMVAGLCTCRAITTDGPGNDIEGSKKCCNGAGVKLSGNLCDTSNFEAFQSCCLSQKASEEFTPTGFDCTL